MNKDGLVGFGIGLAAGAVVGGVLALLFAPQSGKETRELIRDKADRVTLPIRETIDKIKLANVKP